MPVQSRERVTDVALGARHLAQGLVPKMPSGSAISAISSSAAVGWQNQMELLGPLLATPVYGEAVAWFPR